MPVDTPRRVRLPHGSYPRHRGSRLPAVENTTRNHTLKDGDWKCVAYTDIQRTELTVHIKGDKVGLYDTNGKALLANGKDE